MTDNNNKDPNIDEVSPTSSSSSHRPSNNNNKNILDNQIFSHFASNRTSPSLEDSSHTVSIATLNVRGLSTPSKFESLMDDFINSQFSIIGLQETHLPELSGSNLFLASAQPLTKHTGAMMLTTDSEELV